MILSEFTVLFITSILAGALNSVAGGGTFFLFPALIFVGVPPVSANVTATIAVWPGALASAIAYRNELQHYKQILPLLIGVSIAGGGIGAMILLQTPANIFEYLVPWLLLFATLLFTFGSKISFYVKRKLTNKESNEKYKDSILLPAISQLVIAVYGGYFGAGIGILMLAMLALIGMHNVHEMNALKTILGTAINGVAVLIFIASGAVYWPQAVIMIIGAVVGGYFGAYYARKLPADLIRAFVIITASLLTIYFFINT